MYLDYAANTPACEEAIQTFAETTREFPGNPNSPHPAGAVAGKRLKEATASIARLIHAKDDEIIYTSGASESNNLAIKGAARQYRKYGKHIVTTYLEHSSVNGPVAWLKDQGFEIDYVDIGSDGLVDIEHLGELLRDDTILVSVCLVESETGVTQEIDRIADVISKRPHCLLHVDATQAVGKIPVSFEGVDLMTFAPHKFYGLNGCGVLVKKENVLLEPLIHGGISTTPFRSGTPALPLIASTQTALELAILHLAERYKSVKALNARLREALAKYPKIRINSTSHSSPFILNLSVLGAPAENFQQELAKSGICVATKSACCAPRTVSRPVFALTKDKKAALSTLRISLSHLTKSEEIVEFLTCFDSCYQKFC